MVTVVTPVIYLRLQADIGISNLSRGGLRKVKTSTAVKAFASLAILCLILLPVYGQEMRGAEAPRQGPNMMFRLLMRFMDVDNNEQISGGEYMRFFVDVDENKDGSITQEEIIKLTREKRPEMSDRGQEGSRGRQQEGDREQGRGSGGPDADQEAPDFTLRTLDGEGTVRLSDLGGKKPVVLVFGSYT